MKTKDLVHFVPLVVALLIAVLLQLTSAEQMGNSSNVDKTVDDKNTSVPLTGAWIERPPYTTIPSNASLDNAVSGLMRDAVLQYILECGANNKLKYHIKTLRVDSEPAMTRLLRQGTAHMATPVFENPSNPRYSEFLFLKVADYPGTEFITTVNTKTQAVFVVLDAVAKSWPLLTVTIVLTAIAGVIIWALDTYWNPDEFPRSFFRGSWDGFWWSFISMTTVGYGDKAPKSIIARVFSMIWILLGLIIMAIFTATVTSALTALSLELEPNDLVGSNVAVLENGTEYQHALEVEANPIVYHQIDDVIKAVKTRKVDGMLLDMYTASYYQKMGKLESLITVKKLELSRDVGLIFVQNYYSLVRCLHVMRPTIWASVQAITENFKLKHQKPTYFLSMFDESFSVIKTILYGSLGVFFGLLVLGVFWEIGCKRKARKQDVVIGVAVNAGMAMHERTAIHEDLEQGRSLLKQLQEHFDKLEINVVKFQNSARV